MSQTPGLRERKKQRTRELIAETARRLFLERGFDRVTVAQVAREAEVAEQTVFNYFPSKEELFYFRMESFEDELLAAIRERAGGEAIVAAFRRFVLAPRGALGTQDAEQLRQITRVITESPALLAHERRVTERYTQSLADLIAAETGARPGNVEPWVVANALMGVHRALIDYVRERTLAGAAPKDVARGLRVQGERALARLEAGLGGYAPR